MTFMNETLEFIGRCLRDFNNSSGEEVSCHSPKLICERMKERE